MKIRSTLRSRPARRAGFTLVELLLVMVILAVLAAVVIPKFAGRSRQARETAAKTQISNFEVAIDAFEVDTGAYPRTLEDLVVAPATQTSAQDWRGPYLKKGIPLDPWGNEYLYEFPGRHNPASYDLSSPGPDGRPGTEDDIGNWMQSRAPSR